jgi:hypothetical protein
VTTPHLPHNSPTGDLDDDPIVIGLKRLYDSVLAEPVPDEFLSFLAKIDQNAKSGDEQAGGAQ